MNNTASAIQDQPSLHELILCALFAFAIYAIMALPANFIGEKADEKNMTASKKMGPSQGGNLQCAGSPE